MESDSRSNTVTLPGDERVTYQKPCPKCGYCPYCGRGNGYTLPYTTNQYFDTTTLGVTRPVTTADTRSWHFVVGKSEQISLT